MTLQEYLDRHEMSAAEFAERVGVTRAAVYLWLKGVAPQRATMRRIMKATDGELTRQNFNGRAA